jgi:hypothetical protein
VNRVLESFLIRYHQDQRLDVLPGFAVQALTVNIATPPTHGVHSDNDPIARLLDICVHPLSRIYMSVLREWCMCVERGTRSRWTVQRAIPQPTLEKLCRDVASAIVALYVHALTRGSSRE